jgi:OOP family OmpA-OmpF porin
MPAEALENSRGADDDRFDELSELLFGPERQRLRRLEQRLEEAGRAESVADVVAEAIRLRAKRDKGLRKALQSTVEEALSLSVRKNPRMLAEALFPIFGRAVRRAIASELQGMMQNLNLVLEQSLSLRSLRWRWEALRTGRPYPEVVLLRSVLFRVEQVFLIHRKTGLLLEHVISENAVVKDPEMVSGMLTAIQDFVRDSFTESGNDELETARVGAFSILLAYGPQAILAGVVRGTVPRSLQTTFHETIENIHERHLQALVAFEGDVAPFAATRELLSACLLGQGEKEHNRPWPSWLRRGLVWGVPALLICGVAAWITLSILEQRRWSAYLSAVEKQPGIFVTSSGKVNGRYYVTGLRDPLAKDPASFVGPSGMKADHIDARWEPFHSMQPRFAAERRYQELKGGIERRRVRFPLGGAELSFDQEETAREIAAGIRDLFEAGKTTQRSLQLEVRGDTDPLGTEQFNATLARDRARAVFSVFLASGLRPDQVILRGREAAAQPCEAPTERERAACRSVSFRVLEGSSQ